MKSQFSITKFLNTILDRKNLTLAQSEILMEEILQGSLTRSQIASLLTGLRMKGESEEEILGFIKKMREYMIKISFERDVIDVCGTGGDGKWTFNISSATAFVVAGAGVFVAKHGNRAASSKSGSADTLEALGVDISLSKNEAKRCIEIVGMTFLFAPLYHPAMKHVVSVRKELGVRTVFNFLGPFVNPGKIRRQIIGVSNLEIAEKLAGVASFLGYEHLIILTSEDGLDEASVSAKTHIFEIRGRYISQRVLDPGRYGFGGSSLRAILGGSAEKNASIIKNVLDGEKGMRRDIVVLNSAIALYVAGKAKTIDEGVLLAQESIDSRRAKKVLEKMVEFCQKTHPFRYAILNPRENKFSLIAEIKLRSPAEGKLGVKRDVKEKVDAYEKGGADSLSVVVEEKNFGGSYELLSYVRSLSNLPILCKDFVNSEDQIYKAKKHGANAVLLITKILPLDRLVQLVKLVKELGMEPVVEVNTSKELEIASKTDIKILAVNARNIDDFSIDINNACSLLQKIPKTHVALAFSGVRARRDVERYIAAGAKGVLVGTTLMKSRNPAKVIKELKSL